MNNKETAQRKQKSLWPSWFPYPISWLRSLCILLWAGVVLRIAEFWGIVLGTIVSRIMEDPRPLLWFLGMALLAAVLVFSWGHHLLWGKRVKRWPSWFPTPISLWEGLYAPIVLTLASVVAFVCVMPFHSLEYYDAAPTETELKWFAGIWFVTAAYLYQVEYLLRRRLAFKKK